MCWKERQSFSQRLCLKKPVSILRPKKDYKEIKLGLSSKNEAFRWNSLVFLKASLLCIDVWSHKYEKVAHSKIGLRNFSLGLLWGNAVRWFETSAGLVFSPSSSCCLQWKFLLFSRISSKGSLETSRLDQAFSWSENVGLSQLGQEAFAVLRLSNHPLSPPYGLFFLKVVWDLQCTERTWDPQVCQVKKAFMVQYFGLNWSNDFGERD